MSAAVQSRTDDLLQALMRLECPMTRDLDPSHFGDLAFQPGEWRLSLLRWLFSQVDVRLAQSCELSNQAGKPRFAQMAAALGLCPPDRPDVMNGSARKLDQLAFFDKAVRLIAFSAGESPCEPPTPSGAFSPIPSSSSSTSLSQESRAVASRSPEDLAGELEASVDLLNGHLASPELARQLTAGCGSFLAPDLGLLLRGRVEQRKAEMAAAAAPPTAWAMASWRRELERAAEGREEAGSGPFTSAGAAARQNAAVKRLSEGCVRFAAAHERSFRGAIERGGAVRPAAARGREEEFAAKAEALEEGLTALASLRRNVEKAERALAVLELERDDVQAPAREGLAQEVLASTGRR